MGCKLPAPVTAVASPEQRPGPPPYPCAPLRLRVFAGGRPSAGVVVRQSRRGQSSLQQRRHVVGQPRAALRVDLVPLVQPPFGFDQPRQQRGHPRGVPRLAVLAVDQQRGHGGRRGHTRGDNRFVLVELMAESTYAYRLRLRRAAAGLTQRELADMSGVKQPLISAIERGREPTDAVRQLLEQSLQVRPSQVLRVTRQEVKKA